MRGSLLVDRARRIEGMEGEREGHVVDARKIDPRSDLNGNNESLRSRFRFFRCVKVVAGRVLQQPQPQTDISLDRFCRLTY